MKKLLSNIAANAFKSYLSTIAGTYVGLPDIIAGITAHDWQLAAKGTLILLWGLLTNENAEPHN